MSASNWVRGARQTGVAVGLALGALAAATAQDVDATQMIRGSMQVVQMIDQGRTGELWDGASAGARKRVAREDFVRQVTQARAPLGAPQARTWVSVNRQAAGGDDPDLAGQYVSIEYETRFAGREQNDIHIVAKLTAADRLTERKPVHFRHLPVAYHHADRLAGQYFQRGDAIFRLAHDIPPLGEHSGE